LAAGAEDCGIEQFSKSQALPDDGGAAICLTDFHYRRALIFDFGGRSRRETAAPRYRMEALPSAKG
jgi:hypothetical protein